MSKPTWLVELITEARTAYIDATIGGYQTGALKNYNELVSQVAAALDTTEADARNVILCR